MRRVLLPLLTAGVQLAAALVVLGRPDLAQAGAFLGASIPTVQETLAALKVLVWSLVAVSLAFGVTGLVAAGAPLLQAARGRAWEISVAAVGLLLLTAGLAHHAAPQTGLGGGGSVQEARQALGR